MSEFSTHDAMSVYGTWLDGSVYNSTTYYMDFLYNIIEKLDIDYWKWVLWVIYPIVISFLLPIMLLVFLYASVLFLHIYGYRHNLRDAYARNMWDGAVQTLSAIWASQARIWHGYEIEGMENIPDTGPALIIYYHGVVPLDFYYVVARVNLDKRRQIRAVGDRFLFHIPGWRLLMEVFHVTPGTVQSCIDVLNKGHLLAIAPGGVREALFGNESYPLMWSNRNGFAKVAIQANVPVIPMFTKNCREAFRTPSIWRYWLRRLYEKTRLPIVPIYGGFPVKMKTYFGKAIVPTPGISADQFSKQVQEGLQTLINKHQRIPGNIVRALVERVYSMEKHVDS